MEPITQSHGTYYQFFHLFLVGENWLNQLLRGKVLFHHFFLLFYPQPEKSLPLVD